VRSEGTGFRKSDELADQGLEFRGVDAIIGAEAAGSSRVEDALIVFASLAAVVVIAYYRIKWACGYPLLPKSRIQTLFRRKDSD
jgi:hypothetical protein